MDEPDADVVEFASLLFGLARDGQTDRLVAYIDAGVNADLTNQRGDSLLMLAAYHGHAETVRKLIEHGADCDSPNDRGQTPLAGAVFKAEPEVIRVLMAGGADPYRGDPSAIATAALFERPDLAELLGRS